MRDSEAECISNVCHMTSLQVGHWLERTSLVLGFFSFWFAAPELLGIERLKKMEKAIEAILKLTPAIAALIGLVGVVASCIKTIDLTPLKDKQVFNFWPLLTIAIGTLVALIGTWLASLFSKAILVKLQNDDRIRERCLALGVLLFFLSFLLQFSATYCE